MVKTATQTRIDAGLRKLIGQDLPRCLQDIANGRVRIEEVTHVLAAVPYRDRAHMLESVAALRVGRVDRHLEIARQLWDSGRIFMPSVTIDRPAHPVWKATDDAPATPATSDLEIRQEAARSLYGMSLTVDQRKAHHRMVSGMSLVIAGAPRSGRSSLAALAAMNWEGSLGKKALVVCRDGRSALKMRSWNIDNVMTYEEIDELDTSEMLRTLGGFDLFIFDDYDPAWGQVADMCVSGNLLPRDKRRSVVRIVDRDTEMAQSASVVLAATMRAA